MSARFLRNVLKKPKLPDSQITFTVKDAALGRLSEQNEMKYLWQYRKGSIRRRYATFGNQTALKAGICWPSKEELDYMKSYEQKFEKSFAEMRENLFEKKQAAAQKRIDREKVIRENIAKIPEQKKEFWDQYHAMYAEMNKEKLRKEKVIQEVREYLGYDIDVKDPRFEEALLKKDEEEKEALRAQRKLEKQKQALELLQSLVSEALEKEKQASSDSTPKDKKAEESSKNGEKVKNKQNK